MNISKPTFIIGGFAIQPHWNSGMLGSWDAAHSFIVFVVFIVLFLPNGI
jgi:hypothetical protein